MLFSGQPLELNHAGRSIKITRAGLHHKYYEGRVLHHIFSVASETAFYRLNLNTETLNWTLEETGLNE